MRVSECEKRGMNTWIERLRRCQILPRQDCCQLPHAAARYIQCQQEEENFPVFWMNVTLNEAQLLCHCQQRVNIYKQWTAEHWREIDVSWRQRSFSPTSPSR